MSPFSHALQQLNGTKFDQVDMSGPVHAAQNSLHQLYSSLIPSTNYISTTLTTSSPLLPLLTFLSSIPTTIHPSPTLDPTTPPSLTSTSYPSHHPSSTTTSSGERNWADISWGHKVEVVEEEVWKLGYLVEAKKKERKEGKEKKREGRRKRGGTEEKERRGYGCSECLLSVEENAVKAASGQSVSCMKKS
ncbi:hypothetical protein Pmani_029637 [Petrolisthes manimaculis]|uniref:Uncharacterized protein n=1 Tax=Petrolisthes manimaculis TaxID=1843537 RepID=A0AAE1NZ03_9EUCA|nr:hypothetical protein Pmani_029637 [Petrolisthes manimaculis]